MDELERALRAVLDDPAQLNELRALAGSLGLGQAAPAPPAAEPVSAAPEPVSGAPEAVPPAPVPDPTPVKPAGSFAPQTRGASRQEALLQALRPFLRKDRQTKIERALQAAKLAGLASGLLANRRREGP